VHVRHRRAYRDLHGRRSTSHTDTAGRWSGHNCNCRADRHAGVVYSHRNRGARRVTDCNHNRRRDAAHSNLDHELRTADRHAERDFR
jgi:hypothetical protein